MLGESFAIKAGPAEIRPVEIGIVEPNTLQAGIGKNGAPKTRHLKGRAGQNLTRQVDTSLIRYCVVSSPFDVFPYPIDRAKIFA